MKKIKIKYKTVIDDYVTDHVFYLKCMSDRITHVMHLKLHFRVSSYHMLLQIFEYSKKTKHEYTSIHFIL